MLKISDKVNRKFVEVIETDEWLVETDTGWQPITHTNKTIEYDVWRLETEDGLVLECADNHIVFDQYYNEVFVKDLSCGQYIRTKYGLSRVKSSVNQNRKEHMYDLSVDSADHRYYTNDILSHNTTIVAAILLHFALFNDDKVIAVLANKETQAKEIIGRIRQMYEYLPFFMQQGASVYNKKSVKFENGSELFCAATANESIRGRSCAVIYIDEAAFIANDNEFYESTYPVISSGKKTKIIMTSTPRGRRGMFFSIFEGSDKNVEQSKNGYKRLHFTWKDDPRKDEAWKQTTIAEFGLTRFMQEFDVIFRGSSGTLISPNILQDLFFVNPINDVTNDDKLRVYQKYDPSQSYVAFVDTSEGLGKDYSTITVICVSKIPHEVVCVYRNNTISPIVFPRTIVSVCNQYGKCPVLVETNNSSGGQVSYILYYDLEYENVIMTSSNRLTTNIAESGKVLPGVRTSKRVKMVGCSNLSTVIENNNIILNDADMIEELGTFIQKGSSYEADKDCNDDLVMTLILYAWYITQDTFKEYSGNDLTEHIYQQSINQAMESILPFGFNPDAYQAQVPRNDRGIMVTEGGSFDKWLEI